ncbi:MAG: hypothetical protein KF691_08140 [Phycisphaeraceae bacterium]|nr:hypothetical protein [Phycisphaeraceae bacterium]
MSGVESLKNLSDHYRVVRPLEAGAAADRVLVKRAETLSAHVAHTPGEGGLLDARDQIEMSSILSSMRVAHIAPIEEVVRDERNRVVIVTPYFGNSSGQVTLETLATSRGTRLGPEEVEAAADHILHAMDDMHGGRVYNGPIAAKQILVDRQGRVQIEHFGWARIAAKGLRDARTAREDEIRGEVRSVVEVLFRCLTGLDSRTMGVSPSQVVSSLDPVLDEWFAIGLKEGAGFESAAAARAGLPEHQRQRQPPQGGVLRSIGRLLRMGP